MDYAVIVTSSVDTRARVVVCKDWKLATQCLRELYEKYLSEVRVYDFNNTYLTENYGQIVYGLEVVELRISDALEKCS